MDRQNGLPIEILHKEIDLIQSCINRMSKNSFAMKGWFLTIIAAILALLSSTSVTNPVICITDLCWGVAFVSLGFWYLDSYYLMQERMYLWKYNWVIKKRMEGNDQYLYDLKPAREEMWLPKDNGKKRKKPLVICVMFTSWSLTPFYSTILVLSLIFALKG